MPDIFDQLAAKKKSGDVFDSLSGAKKQVVPQAVLDNLQAASANPTQFELDRPGSNRPGGGFLSNFGNVVGSLLTPSDSSQNLDRSNLGLISSKQQQQQLQQRQEQIQAQTEAGNARKAAGYSAPYRALAPMVPGAPQMEESARRGDTAGVLGAAAPIPTAIATTKLIGAGLDALPSKTRAAANFQEVMQAAGNKPVDIASAADSALETAAKANRGGAMPKVVRDFLKRVTDPNQGPLTYAEARDFYSNASRISADEFSRLTPVMRAQLTDFTVNLGKAIGKTAEQAGKGAQYQAAMKEYSQAATLGKYAANAKKIGIAAGAGAAGMGIVHKLLNP